jgi:hypothetical protein
MIILNNTIENLSALVELLASIGNVVQVRANEVLREAVKAKLGGESLHICCMVKRRDGADHYIQFRDYIHVEDITNIDKHQGIVQKFKMNIDNYIYKDILPDQMTDMATAVAYDLQA